LSFLGSNADRRATVTGRMTDRPQTAAGYRAEETAQVVAACLTLAGALGDLSDELCIVGGLVPSMICDTRVDPSALDDGAHVGTSDLDIDRQRVAPAGLELRLTRSTIRFSRNSGSGTPASSSSGRR
jgi:hypothetical protein